MKGLTLKKIEEVTGGCLHAADGADLNAEIASVTTDSRKAGAGSLFGAIVGVRVDGHVFIPQVFEQGALCVLSEKELPEPAGSWIRVEDTQTALQKIAREYLRVLNIPVVGITGSVGKTSTKEMIASVLSVKYRTLKTEGNFNNDLGLPLTVFRLTEQDQIAVLEMGISHFGDMTRLARIACPDTMVITNIGTCHLEFLQDRDGVFRAKTEAFSYVKDGGHVVLNQDDDKLRMLADYPRIPDETEETGIKNDVEAESRCEVNREADREEHSDWSAIRHAELKQKGITSVSFGISESADVFADQIRPLGFSGTFCVMHTPKGSFEVTVPSPGLHNVSNAAAAAAVGLIYGETPEEIRQGIETASLPGGRFRVIEADGMTVIDDCYNANPMSMKASLSVLGQDTGRRVAILGDMGELGADEAALHEEIGRYAAGQTDRLIAVGALSKTMFDAAREEKPDLDAYWYETADAFLPEKDALLNKGDSVLVKASHFMNFEKIVKALTEE